MARKQKAETAPKTPSIWVSRESLSLVLAMHPVTDDQRRTLVTSTIQKWPRDYELHDTEQVKALLDEIKIGWRAHK